MSSNVNVSLAPEQWRNILSIPAGARITEYEVPTPSLTIILSGEVSYFSSSLRTIWPNASLPTIPISSTSAPKRFIPIPVLDTEPPRLTLAASIAISCPGLKRSLIDFSSLLLKAGVMSRQICPAAIAFFLPIKIPPCVINMQCKCSSIITLISPDINLYQGWLLLCFVFVLSLFYILSKFKPFQIWSLCYKKFYSFFPERKEGDFCQNLDLQSGNKFICFFNINNIKCNMVHCTVTQCCFFVFRWV